MRTRTIHAKQSQQEGPILTRESATSCRRPQTCSETTRRKVVIWRAALTLGLVTLIPSATWADVRFTRLSENQFVVHHRKLTRFGAEAKATGTAYREAASLCVASGHSHMEIKDQHTGERLFGGTFGGGRGASADLRIKLYVDPEESTIDEKSLVECKPLSAPRKVSAARRKLARDGLVRD